MKMSLPTILIAEDNRISARILQQSLAVRGYSVLVASDGEKALAHALDKTPDLVVSDVMMPGMDGYELCRRLRTNPPTSEVPIILLTARAGIEEERRGLEAGADDFLVKPVDPTELRSRVASLLARREAFSVEGPGPIPSWPGGGCVQPGRQSRSPFLGTLSDRDSGPNVERR
jgi:DNA-binding response OmpR family regulator